MNFRGITNGGSDTLKDIKNKVGYSGFQGESEDLARMILVGEQLGSTA